MDDRVRDVLDEIGNAVEAIDEAQARRLSQVIAKAGRIVVYAGGREGLQVKGFAMRMFHLGLPVAVAGDMTAPHLGKGDLLLVCCGPGETSTVLALMREVKKAGAATFAVTAEKNGSAAKLADDLLLIPAQTMASDQGSAKTSVLPMGSLFEGALFVLFELLVLRLQKMLGETADSMRARHTNVE